MKIFIGEGELARPVWFVNLIKKAFPQRFWMARLTHLPLLGDLIDWGFFDGDDLIYLPGPVLAAVSDSHLFTALIVMVMTGIFIAGLYLRPRRFRRLSWFNGALIVLFFLGAYLSFTTA